jgi:octaprenyl-diphosphate synthase
MTASALMDLSNGRIRPELLAQVAEEVVLVEAELDRQMHSQVDMVKNVSHHTLDAGGKRLRPAFVALSAKATGIPYDEERSRKIGACMEMIHMATLIHDDVIDNSATRRGKETASAVYGNTGSILAGDVLLAKAMRILAEDGDLAIIRTTSHSVVEMAEGEVRELETRLQFDLAEEAHLEILRLKTASFIQCCCEVGALIAGASPAIQQALHDYGHHVGMAFQIVDDLLDYRGDKAKTGKPLATDFREGQATLPLIYLKEKLSTQEASVARQKFGSGVTDDEIRMISDWMATRGSFDQAELLAVDHIRQALEALAKLPETPSRDLLETVAHYVIRREL